MSDRQTSNSFFVLPTIHTPPIDSDGDPTIQLPALSEVEVEAVDLLSEDEQNAMGHAESELGDRLRVLTAPAPPADERGVSSSSAGFLRTAKATGTQHAVAVFRAATLVLVTSRRAFLGVMRLANTTARACASALVHALSVARKVVRSSRGGNRLSRTRVLRFRVSEAELAIVTAVANRSGCQPCDIVRVLIEEQYRGLLARRGDGRTSDGSTQGVQEECEMELAGVRRSLVMPPHD